MKKAVTSKIHNPPFRCLLYLYLLVLPLSSLASNDVICEGRQWKSSKEELECRFPHPPHGRWHAVYSEEFAKKYNLPIENVSTDLSSGVDYMEMDVQPYGNGGTACLVNMLIKKPNDVAVYTGSLAKGWEREFHKQRSLLQWIDVNDSKDDLREIATFGFSSRTGDYDPKRSYSIGSSLAFYGKGIVEGYDYISANSSCYHILKYKKGFPDKWAFNYAKASVWGRNQYKFSGLNDPKRPRGKEYFDSRARINIPKEIILEIFKDMPIGGRR